MQPLERHGAGMVLLLWFLIGLNLVLADFPSESNRQRAREHQQALAPPRSQQRTVMPWMCLERCHEDVAGDKKRLEQKAAGGLLGSLAKLSFEDYDLGSEANLVWNGFSEINGWAQSALNAESFPMITTANLEYLRTLIHYSGSGEKGEEVKGNSTISDGFAAVSPFVTDAVERAIKFNYSGYNIDFEPTGAATSADATAYASFLDQFALALHKHGKKLSVDIASWSQIWDFEQLAKTSVDQFISMDTYAKEWTYFQTGFHKATNTFGIQRVGIGLCPSCFDATADMLKQRFDLIQATGIVEIDIWDTPVPDSWWNPFIAGFVNATVL